MWNLASFAFITLEAAVSAVVAGVPNERVRGNAMSLEGLAKSTDGTVHRETFAIVNPASP